jgi:hypothetical protein
MGEVNPSLLPSSVSGQVHRGAALMAAWAGLDGEGVHHRASGTGTGEGMMAAGARNADAIEQHWPFDSELVDLVCSRLAPVWRADLWGKCTAAARPPRLRDMVVNGAEYNHPNSSEWYTT